MNKLRVNKTKELTVFEITGGFDDPSGSVTFVKTPTYNFHSVEIRIDGGGKFTTTTKSEPNIESVKKLFQAGLKWKSN